MKKISTAEIKELLARRPVGPAPEAGVFWSEFRGRARMVHQDYLVAAPARFSPGRLAFATACAALLIVMGGVFLSQRAAVDDPAGRMTLDVQVAHSAVLVIEDEVSQSTIVWISDMQLEDVDEADGDSV